MSRWSDLAIWIVLGVAALGGAVATYLQGAATHSWDTVEGEVVAAAIDVHPGSEDQATHHEPVVSYRYTVAGREYRGDKIVQFDASYSHRPEAEAILAEYEVGSLVTVYYDPADPGSALLEPGVQLPVPIGLGVTGLVLLGSVLMLWYRKEDDVDDDDVESEGA